MNGGKHNDEFANQQIRSLRMQGVSYLKIGGILGVPDNTVRSFCRRCGLGEEAKNTCCCKQCGKLIKIIPKRKPKIFCSDECRAEWWNSHPESVHRKAIECYFEKEGIYTFDGKGELLITIMSSLAQEESRSISENVTWGQRKSFSDGKVHLAYTRFLGYEKGEDGRPAVVKEEAAVVRLIYRLFLEGKTPTGISNYLESLQIPSPGGSSRWSKTTIMSILQNEKYKGDALLQKSFTVDFLQKKLKRNEGEVPQYAVAGGIPEEIRGSHTAIRNSRRRAGTPAGSPHPANPAGQSNGTQIKVGA